MILCPKCICRRCKYKADCGECGRCDGMDTIKCGMYEPRED